MTGSARRSAFLAAEDDRASPVRRHGARSEASALALRTLGVGSVVLGGLVAAVTGPLDLAKGSWLAAYLVLVCGVAGCVIGSRQVATGMTARHPHRARLQLGGWVAGNTMVIVGSLAAGPAVVDVGSVLLLVALGIALADAVHPAHRRQPGRDVPGSVRDRLYAALVVVLMLSVPIGAVLAHLRSAS